MTYFLPAGGGGGCTPDFIRKSLKSLGTARAPAMYWRKARDNWLRLASVLPPSGKTTGSGVAPSFIVGGPCLARDSAVGGGAFLQAHREVIASRRMARLMRFENNFG